MLITFLVGNMKLDFRTTEDTLESFSSSSFYHFSFGWSVPGMCVISVRTVGGFRWLDYNSLNHEPCAMVITKQFFFIKKKSSL